MTAQLNDDHRNYLRSAAITDQVMESAGIHSTDSGIVFPYRWEDQEVLNFRPDAPGDGPKYVWPKDVPAIFNLVRTVFGTGPVMIVEGTKQALAVASWAPPEYSVVGMNGCWGWTKKDLSWFSDRITYVIMDGDAADNLDVYTAAQRFAEALEMEDAKVSFIRLPVQGKEGADDYLSDVAEDKRTDRLAKLAGRAKSKPADRKPAAKSRKPAETPLPELDGRIGVAVNGDRNMVINKIIDGLKERLNGTELFNYGNAITKINGHTAEPLALGSFLRLLHSNIACFNYTEETSTKPAKFDPGEPTAQTVQAVMSSADEFAQLDKIVRMPFVRPDGSVCSKSGYDQDTHALVVLSPDMDRISVPENPTREDARAASELLLTEMFGDMPFEGQSDRANVLALLLTPFLRGNFPVVPLAVLTGLQMGVGKNKIADCLSILVSGEVQEALHYIQDEDEIRKQITSAFRSATPLFEFDEAHKINSMALARALTQTRYTDRELGRSRMIAFPNQVTWLSMGNRVQVSGDMIRRVYYVSLIPKSANPQDRLSDSFKHPDLTGWVMENRAELVSAVLTIIRAWYTAGKPRTPRKTSMGSFEIWDSMMTGITEYAGQPGFLGDLKIKRSESDFTTRSWVEHLVWLRNTFGTDTTFTGKEVLRAAVSDHDFEAPPGMEDTTDKGWTRELGKQYARITDRWFDTASTMIRITKTGIGHGTVIKWAIQEMKDGTDTDPESVGKDVWEGSTPPSRKEKNNSRIAISVMGNSEKKFSQDEGRIDPPVPSHPSADPFDVPEEETRTMTSDEIIPGHVIGFDLETHSADTLFTHPVGEYLKLVGAGPADDVRVSSDTGSLRALESAETIVTHNGSLFDLPAIDRHHGIPVESTIPRVHDLRLVAFQADPPHSGETKLGPGFKRYSLDALAKRYLDGAKSEDGKALAVEFSPVCKTDKVTGTHTVAYVNGVSEGKSWEVPEPLSGKERENLGWGNIPDDDPRFLAYCRDDVSLSLALAKELPMTDYDRREARVAAVTARATLSGFRVDVPALEARVKALQEDSERRREMLADTYGFPLGSPAPQRTNAGKAAFRAALADLGMPLGNWPKNKDGSLSLSKDTLTKAIEWATEKSHPALGVITAVQELNGVRNNAANLLRYTVGDRVHPKFEPFQATGRWSITEPGLTVLAKPKPGKPSEREFLLPDEGHVLVSIDLDQADPRCVAAHSQDPNLLEIVNNPATDIHTEVSLMAFGSAEPQYRTPTKSLDIGWMYGRGVGGMVKNTKGMTDEIANIVVNAMKDRFGVVMQWQQRVRQMAEVGLMLNNGFGRNLRVDGSSSYSLFTQPPALIGQATTRDIIAEGLLTMAEKAPHLLQYLRVIVHDEIVMSLPEDRANELAEEARQCLDRWWAPAGLAEKVHFTAGDPEDGFVFGRNWKECYDKK